MIVEACVESLDAALAAEQGGADRIELCAALEVGGVTPAWETVSAVRERLGIPVHVLIRPRAGEEYYSVAQLRAMAHAASRALALGADGVVTGALTADARVDRDALRVLMEGVPPSRITFHRAFDRARDPDEALDALVELGIARVLTSGGAPTAAEGIPVLARLVRRAGSAITILAGGSVRAPNVARIVRETGVREVHARTGASSARVRELVQAAHAP